MVIVLAVGRIVGWVCEWMSSAARELSALVFDTRGGTGATDKCLERMAVTPNGKVLIGSESELGLVLEFQTVA